MDRGVIYLLAGETYSELFAVSVHSLRDHYDGPVTVFCTDGQAAKLAHRVACDRRLGPLDVRVIQPAIRGHKPKLQRESYCTKPHLTRETPYKRTVFLDADTVVQRNIDALFEPPLAITQFCNWVSTGKIVGGRIGRWKGISPAIDALVERSLAIEYPAINTGVFGFHKDFHGLAAWRQVTTLGVRRTFTDELAMQLLFPSWPDCRVFGSEFNQSAKYAKACDYPAARVIHFHGRSHVRKDRGWGLWRPFLERALSDDAGGLEEWAGKRDPGVRWRLRQLRRSERATSEAA